MADDNDVQIRFTADTDAAEEGIANVQKALNGLKQSMSDVSGAAAGLHGAFNAALPTDKLADASKAFAGVGDQTARATSQLREMGNAIRAADAAFNSTRQHLAAELKMHEITYEQETAALLAALDQRRDKEEAAIDDQLVQFARGTQGYEKALAQRRQIETKYFAERQRIVDQAAEHEAQEWKAVADQVAGAFNSNLQKLLAGTESWSQAMKKVSADLVLKFIQDQVKLTLEFLANQARQLATHIAGEAAKTGATTTGAALRSAAEVLSGQTSIVETIANAFKAIFASAGQTGAAVTAFVAPTVGPAAPAIGAAAAATVVAENAPLVSMDVGGYVVSSGIAMVHQGEVIPAAKVNTPYHGDSMGGNSTTISPSINITAMDSRSVARFFNDNAHHMVRALQRGLKSGAHLPLRSSMR